MTNLLRANEELFRRSPDECFDSLDALAAHCQRQQQQSQDRWEAPANFAAVEGGGRLSLKLGTDGASLLNDWSFGQLCRLATVAKDRTVAGVL